MRYLIVIIFSAILIKCKPISDINPPEPPIFEYSQEKKDIISKAKNDYNNGLRAYTFTGFMDNSDGFLNYFSNYMLEKHQINIEYHCNPSYDEEFYIREINWRMEKEYGENFFNKKLKKARRLFKRNTK